MRLVVAAACLLACSQPAPPPASAPAAAKPDAKTGASPKKPAARAIESPEREARHLQHAAALTTDGRNGEAYFSPDGATIVFQSIRGPSPHYQMYLMNDEGNGQRLLSTGRGKCTCGFFRPDGQKVIYASSHSDPKAFRPGDPKPPEPPRSERYKWDFDPHMEIYEADPDGKNLRRLTISGGYDAEGGYSHGGRHIAFTSMRDGDAEIYVMDANGEKPRRITRSPGYDGGPFFSADDAWIVFRSFRYRRDDRAEIFLVRADGTGEKQVTDLGVVSFGPFFHPDGRRLIFSANLEGHNFELYLVNLDGTGLERVTFEPRADVLPSFSSDGRRILWTSNRGPGGDPERGTSQVWSADWID